MANIGLLIAAGLGLWALFKGVKQTAKTTTPTTKIAGPILAPGDSAIVNGNLVTVPMDVGPVIADKDGNLYPISGGPPIFLAQPVLPAPVSSTPVTVAVPVVESMETVATVELMRSVEATQTPGPTPGTVEGYWGWLFLGGDPRNEANYKWTFFPPGSIDSTGTNPFAPYKLSDDRSRIIRA